MEFVNWLRAQNGGLKYWQSVQLAFRSCLYVGEWAMAGLLLWVITGPQPQNTDSVDMDFPPYIYIYCLKLRFSTLQGFEL